MISMLKSLWSKAFGERLLTPEEESDRRAIEAYDSSFSFARIGMWTYTAENVSEHGGRLQMMPAKYWETREEAFADARRNAQEYQTVKLQQKAKCPSCNHGVWNDVEELRAPL